MKTIENQPLNDDERKVKGVYDERKVASASPLPLLIALIALVAAVIAYGIVGD